MKRLLLILFAVIAATLGPVAPTALAVDVPTLTAQAYAYAYDRHDNAAPLTGTTIERGPPAIACDHTTPNSAVDTASYGPSLRPQPRSPSTYNDYDHLVQFARGDSDRVTTLTASGGSARDVRAVSGLRCAANTGARLAQDLAVSPVAPRALPLTGRSVGRATHDAEIQKILSGLDGASDIRIVRPPEIWSRTCENPSMSERTGVSDGCCEEVVA